MKRITPKNNNKLTYGVARAFFALPRWSFKAFLVPSVLPRGELFFSILSAIFVSLDACVDFAQ